MRSSRSRFWPNSGVFSFFSSVFYRFFRLEKVPPLLSPLLRVPTALALAPNLLPPAIALALAPQGLGWSGMLIPDELKLESYERRANAAVFDRLDLVVAFRAGNGGIGAVVRSFIDAIKLHDEVVAKIEGFTTQIDELKRNYRKKNRLFRNLDSAWNLILDNPVEYYEYLRLLPQMTNIERELEEVTDPVVRVELTAKHARFKELEPVCSKQLQIYNAYAKARGERDEAVRILVAAEKELQQLREQEKHVAAQISDDHITADEQQKPLSTVFPNVQGTLTILLCLAKTIPTLIEIRL